MSTIALTSGGARRSLARQLTINSVCYALVAACIVVLVGGSDWTFMGLSFAVLFASATFGIIAGFMFGVPRMSAAQTAAAAGVPAGLALNSNLVKVSDWLTTIVIGLGLVQFHAVLDGLRWMGNQFSVVFDNQLGSEAAAVYGLSLVFSSLGLAFVVMYLWTSATVIDVFSDVAGAAASRTGDQ